MYWTPPISMDTPSMALLWPIMLLSAILTRKKFLTFFQINYENKDIFLSHTEQSLSI